MTPLEERLRELPIPEEDVAEERAWRVVSAAYADHAPVQARRPVRRFVAAAVAAVAIAVLALTPAGAKVVDAVQDVIGIDDAKPLPESVPLPAAGEVLVDSETGPWIVRDDGSKHRLGDYGESTFSAPRGLFIAATDGRRLLALEPDGNVRWSITAPAEVSDPRWAPSGNRVAYKSGDELRVVGGDGTFDHAVAQNVAMPSPAWRPTVLKGAGEAGPEQVSFVDRTGRIRLVDADTGEDVPGGVDARAEPEGVRELAWSTDGSRLVTLSRRQLRVDAFGSGMVGAYKTIRETSLVDFTLAPSGDDIAILEDADGISTIKRLSLSAKPVDTELFSGPGAIEGLTFSPDSRWLFAGWRDADQWLFIEADRPRNLMAVDDVSKLFAEDGGDSAFPHVSGWVLPPR